MTDFHLIETFAVYPETGAQRIAMHLDRMQSSAAALDVRFDRKRAREIVDTIEAQSPLRCRLTCEASGDLALSSAPFEPVTRSWKLAVAADKLDANDPWLRHKSSNRAVYDTARAALDRSIDELLFENQFGHLCEGTITNIFVDDGSGVLVTPPLSDGVLPGVLRRSLIESGRAREASISHHDAESAKKLYVGNSLRGLIEGRFQ